MSILITVCFVLNTSPCQSPVLYNLCMPYMVVILLNNVIYVGSFLVSSTSQWLVSKSYIHEVGILKQLFWYN